MTRVVHVLHSLGMGGLEKGVATVVSNAAPGFEHEVVCLAQSGPAAALLPPAVRVHEMHRPAGNSPRFVWRLSRTLKSLAPDVVHTRNWGGLDGVAAARLAGLRVVHGEHGWDASDPDGSSAKRRFVRRLAQRWITEYTCVSRHIESWLRERIGIRKPITQIDNGVDTDRYRPRDAAAIRTALGLGAGTFVVGIVARLDPIKDHETLFAAYRALQSTHPDSALLVVGDGEQRALLEPLAGNGIHLLGHRSDVPEVMSACDVFVLCSLNEGISNTILEAMATGLPVVATRVGGSPEIVQEDREGRLVEPRDVDAIARALRTYAADPRVRAAHGAAARARAVERFSIAAMARAYEEVWARVAARSRVGRRA